MWQIGLFSNMRLVIVVLASFALQLAIHDLPVLQRLFGTAPMSVPSMCDMDGAWRGATDRARTGEARASWSTFSRRRIMHLKYPRR